MKIIRAISYRGAWERMNSSYTKELHEIFNSFGLIDHTHFDSSRNVPRMVEDQFYRTLQLLGWETFDQSMKNAGRHIRLSIGLGHYKNNISARIMVNPYTTQQLIFSSSQVANKNGFVDIPIILVFSREVRVGFPYDIFEKVLRELKSNEPLTLRSPFLVLEFGLEDVETRVYNVLAEADMAKDEVSLSRCLEFPPEHYQAGVGILSYFGEILKARFPGKNTQFSIQQEGNIVRMIVISEKGDKQTIESTFEDYQKVLVGLKKPEELGLAQLDINKLKMELRLAETRIECLKDMVEDKRVEIRNLSDLLAASINRTNPITIAPIIDVTNINTQVYSHTEKVLEMIGALEDTMSLIPSHLQNEVTELSTDLELAAGKNKEELKESKEMQRLTSLIKDMGSRGSKLNDFLIKTTDGMDAIEKLLLRYNSLAKLIGLASITFGM